MSWHDIVTEEEEKAVEEFRKITKESCTPKMLEDETLFYRFMKARDFNLKNAEDMLKKHIAWRKEFQIDTILTDYKPPETVVKYTTFSLIGFDKEGATVKYIDVGRLDSQGLMSAVKKIDLLKHSLKLHEQDLEASHERSKKTGKTFKKVVHIFNFDETSFAKATNKKGLEFLIYYSKMFQDNYPESFKQVFIINASVFFKMLFSVLKPWVAHAVLEKCQIFGSDGFQEPLLELIDAEVLPAFLGGTRTDPDGNPNCHTFIKYGEKVPEDLYMRKSERTLSSVPGVKRLNIGRFSKSELKFEVQEAGSFLEWEFETKNRDIGFGLYFREKGAKLVELVPKQRIDTDYEPETGMFKCEKAGTYIIAFDNSYSWIHGKDIFYKIRIVIPKDEGDR